jgi:adenylate cyclase
MSSEAPKASVLVVDDNDVNCVLLRRRLESAGHIVTVAHDGREALRKIDEERFDLVLLDVMMPEMSGLEVLEIVRKRFGVADLPIIMATAADESADIVKAFGMGANDYVTKPFDFSVVMARTRTQLALRSAMEENRRLVQEVELRNRFIRQTFGRYLDNEVVSRLLENEEGLTLGGEKRRISVLMSDLRGFTSLAERLSPEDVVAVINNYLTVMTDVIMLSGGTIDEFIGDGILVLFGAPVERADHARAAVACALRMEQAISEVNRRSAERGLPLVEMGIGINSGEVVVGNIGSEKRAKYGVVGRHVNLASRIESYTVGGQILIAESTRQEAGDDLVVERSIEVLPKGLPDPILMHSVRGMRRENLMLSDNDDDLVNLPETLPAGIAVMEGKDAGGALTDAELVALSPRGAVVRSTMRPEVLWNVRLHLHLGSQIDNLAIYAKVTESPAAGESLFRVRFTAVPSEVAQKIEEILRG